MPVRSSLLPNRVRHDEIEQSVLFGGLLLFEQSVHVSDEFGQPDPGFHVMAVGVALPVEVCPNPGLLVVKFAWLPLE
jgi:hypothetical protein